MIKFISKYKTSGFILLIIIALSPYFYLSFFAHPIADDFLYAILSRKMGIVDGMFFLYKSWSGRFASNVTELLNPLVWNSLTFYKIMPLVLFILTFLSAYFLASNLFGKILKKSEVILTALFILLIYIFQLPTLTEGFYWFSGSCEYQVSVVFSWILIGVLISYFQQKSFVKKMFLSGLIIVINIILIGFNETYVLILCGFYLCAFIISIYHKQQYKYFWLILFLISLIVSIFSLMAPGNAVRGSNFEGEHFKFVKSFVFSMLQVPRFFFSWISNVPFILGTFLIIPLTIKLGKQFDFIRNHFYIHPVLASILLPLIIFLCVFPAYWATGILGQHRTLNIAYALFILLWFGVVACWTNFLEQKKCLPQIAINSKWQTIFIIFIIMTMVLTGNGYNAFTDIIYGRAQKFDRIMLERYSIMKQTKAQSIKCCEFKEIEDKPVTLFFIDITRDENHWINRGYEEYFGVKARIK